MVMRKIKSKKTKQLLKTFAEDEQDEVEVVDQIEEEQQSVEQEIEQPKEKMARSTMKSLMSSVLKAHIKSSQPLFAENKQPLETLRADKEKKKESTLKKKLKKQIVAKGHIDPKLHNNKVIERELKVTCAKGVMKVFEALRKAKEQTQE